MRISVFNDKISNDIDRIKQKILSPATTDASILAFVSSLPSIRKISNSYVDSWKGKYNELKSQYGDVLSDSILAMELASMLNIQEADPNIRKQIQDFVDLGNILNNQLARTKMTKIIATYTISQVTESIPPDEDVIDYGGISGPMTTGSTHPVRIVTHQHKNRWVKFNDVWYWDKDMDFTLDVEVEEPSHISNLDNNRTAKSTYMTLYRISPITLGRVNKQKVSKMVNKAIQQESKYAFIDNLEESRTFKRLSLVRGMSVDDIAIKALNFLLALKVVYHEDKKQAARYAQQLVNQQSYSGFKTSQPDLYNVLVLVFKQDQYSDLVKGSDITLPELRIKRNLRIMASGKVDERDYNEMLIMMLRRLKGVESIHWRIRRRIADYSDMNSHDKEQLMRYLMILMRKGEQVYPDLYIVIERIAQKLRMRA
jgi:hypothetical protein